MKNFGLYLILTALLTGCASMFSTNRQAVQVVPLNAQNQVIADAVCTANNDQESYTLIAPNTPALHRGHESLTIKCVSQDGKLYGTTTVDSAYNKVNLWNIPLTIFVLPFGIAGWIIDYNNGSTGEYPSYINVDMQPDTRNVQDSNALIFVPHNP